MEFKPIVFASHQAGTGQPVGRCSRLRHHDQWELQSFGFMNGQDVERVLWLVKSARWLGLPFIGFIQRRGEQTVEKVRGEIRSSSVLAGHSAEGLHALEHLVEPLLSVGTAGKQQE